MISHIFRMNAESLDPAVRMHAVANRLWDMGYQYDPVNDATKMQILQDAMNTGIDIHHESQTVLNTAFYLKDGREQFALDRVVVSKTGPLGALLPHDKIDFFTEFHAFPSTFVRDVFIRAEKTITVADFLAEAHPHPFKSAAIRIANDVRGLFVP